MTKCLILCTDQFGEIMSLPLFFFLFSLYMLFNNLILSFTLPIYSRSTPYISFLVGFFLQIIESNILIWEKSQDTTNENQFAL